MSAGLHRDDLCTAIGSCNHGFEMLAPLSLFDGAEHAVFARGVDVGSPLSAQLDPTVAARWLSHASEKARIPAPPPWILAFPRAHQGSSTPW